MSNLDILLSILGMCNLGTLIKDLCLYISVSKKYKFLDKWLLQLSRNVHFEALKSLNVRVSETSVYLTNIAHLNPARGITASRATKIH